MPTAPKSFDETSARNSRHNDSLWIWFQYWRSIGIERIESGSLVSCEITMYNDWSFKVVAGQRAPASSQFFTNYIIIQVDVLLLQNMISTYDSRKFFSVWLALMSKILLMQAFAWLADMVKAQISEQLYGKRVDKKPDLCNPSYFDRSPFILFLAHRHFCWISLCMCRRFAQ